MNAFRFGLRLLWWVLLGLLALLALLLATWLPFNVGDAAPRPPAAALQPPAARVADDRNSAYALEGLLAEAGRDPAGAGRAVWAAHKSWATLPAPQRAAAAAGSAAKANDSLGKALAAPKGAPLLCEGPRDSCDAAWFAAADALDKQRASHGLLGERCEKLIDGPFEFEELLPPGRGADAPLMSWAPMSHCSRWFRSGAILALARGRREEALAQLRRADRLHRGLWEGARTLVGHMVATRLARATYDTMAVAAMRDAVLAEAMAPWLATPLDTRQAARRWMVFEAAFQRGIVDELGPTGAWALADAPNPIMGADPLVRLAGELTRRRIGFHPERTKQRIDEVWLRQIGHLQYAWPAVLAGAKVEQSARAQRGAWSQLQWRNTFGELLVEVAAAGAGSGYFARHADHELHREAAALVLMLERQRVTSAQRAEAARRLPGPSDALKERMSWSADGRTLTVRPWQSETAGSIYDPRRDSIIFSWP